MLWFDALFSENCLQPENSESFLPYGLQSGNLSEVSCVLQLN
jgi:hypothetical protein